MVQVIYDNKKNEETMEKLPLLVYVSREKRPSHPHRFKAGALNALVRRRILYFLIARSKITF